MKIAQKTKNLIPILKIDKTKKRPGKVVKVNKIV